MAISGAKMAPKWGVHNLAEAGFQSGVAKPSSEVRLHDGTVSFGPTFELGRGRQTATRRGTYHWLRSVAGSLASPRERGISRHLAVQCGGDHFMGIFLGLDCNAALRLRLATSSNR